jgi:FKBP-type peptidyl-prolyl cis-trans isomerase
MPARLLRRSAARTLLLGAVAASGCSDSTGPVFDESLGVDLSVMTQTASGLYYLDMTVGTGTAAAPGSSARVQYSGWLASGVQFDSGSFTFRLSSGQAIAGFDEGVQGMQVGGRRRIVVPPELGYGDRRVGSIPPNSYLLFDMQLLSVTP